MSGAFARTEEKCLVLGGCGFMGSHLAEGLIASGYEVRIFDKVNIGTQNIDHIADAVELVEGDFTNEVEVARAVKGMDYIFHFIGTTVPKTSTDNPVYDIESNVVATVRMLDLATKEKVKKIVFASSGGTVYGIPQTIPLPEDHPTNPTCSYGITKLTIEKYLELYHRTRGQDYVCFRIANPYGERQNPQAIQGAVAVFLGLVKEGKPVTIWGSGTITRDYIYIKDIVPLLVNVLRANPRSRVFNLGSGKGTSLRELITIIKEVTNKEIAVTYSEGRPIDVPTNILDISRIQKEFGFCPKIPLSEGVRRTWEWLNRLS